MLDWFNSLSSTMQVLWGSAIVASIIFVIQNILLLMGIGDMDTDVDTDFDTDSATDGDTLGSPGIFSLFTLRNFINFFLGFGWGGVSLAPVIGNKTLLILAAVCCGLLFVALFVILMRAILKLEHNGAFRIQDCVGHTATVYLRIPAKREAAGIIQISINGSVHEISAFTDGEVLPTGIRVKVVGIIDSGSLLVDKIEDLPS